MRIEILAKNYDVSQKFEDILTKKLTRLDKFFEDDVKAKVFCKKERNTFILEITVSAVPNTMRAEARNTEDMYQNIDGAIAKLIRQIHRHKDRMGDKIISDFAKEKELLKYIADDNEKPATVVKKKTFDLVPMSIEDAIIKLDMIDHNFFVFLSKDTGRVNVLYKRLDGDYGVIETIVD